MIRHRSQRLTVFALALAAVPSFAGARLRAQSDDLLDLRRPDRRVLILENRQLEKPSLSTVGVLGDLDGDGRDDIGVSGSLLYENGAYVELFSRIYYGTVRHGRFDVEDPSFRTTTLRTSAPDQRVWFYLAAGDIDGDGFDDALFSAIDARFFDPVRAGYLLYGSDELPGEISLEDDIGASLRGCRIVNSRSAWRGASINQVGDVNADGTADLSFSYGHAQIPGRAPTSDIVIVFADPQFPAVLDLADVPGTRPGIRIIGDSVERETDSAFQSSVVFAAGDVNRDGFGDLLIPLWSDFAGSPRAPSALLLYGAAESAVFDLRGVDAGHTRWRLFEHTDYESKFGAFWGSVGVGDIDRDGFDDFVIGAPDRCCVPVFGARGHSYLIYGAPDYPRVTDVSIAPAGLLTKIAGLEIADGFGARASGPIDWDGDGLPDLAFGTQTKDRAGAIRVGEAYLISPPRDRPPELELRTGFRGTRIIGDVSGDHLALTSQPLGDFDGDGNVDLLLQANNRKSVDEFILPRLYVVFGTGGAPLPMLAREVHPANGTLRGGTEVTILGSRFPREARVFFGERESTAVSWRSPTELVAISPPSRGGRGVVSLRVEAAGESSTLVDGFEYLEHLPVYDSARPGDSMLALRGEVGSWPGASIDFGDLDGDGVDELVVAGSRAEEPVRVTIIHGTSPRLSGELALFDPGARRTQIRFLSPPDVVPTVAADVRVLDDLDGDSRPELGIGLTALAFVLLGRDEWPEQIFIERELERGRAFLIEGALEFPPRFRLRLLTIGDVTGDGLADLFVGDANAPGRDRDAISGPFSGEIALLEGRREWPCAISLDHDPVNGRVLGVGPGAALGAVLDDARDFDGDGARDLLAVSSVSAASGGRSWLLRGSRDMSRQAPVSALVSLDEAIELSFDAELFGRYFWLNASAAGDLDADGLEDLAFGLEGGGPESEGRSLIVFGDESLQGSVDVRDLGRSLSIIGEGRYEQSGRNAPAGDFNHDGIDDLLIGGPGFQNISGEAGNVFVVFGSRELPAELKLSELRDAGLKIPGRVDFGGAGSTVAQRPGDLDGDGQPDIAFSEVGLPERAGSVYVAYGAWGEKSFVRGDANRDLRIDISDAIAVLSHLFLGTAAPPCLDAADADDNGRLELTDAIRVLGSLFLGGAAPAPPYPEPGRDPSDDALDCLGF